MKKVAFFAGLLIAAALNLFTGCEDDVHTPTVPETPKSYMEFSRDTIIFNNTKTQNLNFVAKYSATCEYSVISAPDWVTVYPESGALYKTIGNISITPKVGDEGGIYEGKLIIMSTLNKTLDTIALFGYFDTQLPDTLYFGPSENSKTFEIANFYKSAKTYSLSAENDLITLGANSCTINKGERQTIKVDAVRAKMLIGTNFSKIFVSDGERTDTIQVIIEHYKESKTILNTNVIDAEYSKAKDMLVFVSSNPSMLNIYWPNTANSAQVSLNFVPTCVSLSLDGKNAVVGHDGRITYVDLENKSIIRTYNISCNALDVVLGNNKWAYVFPKEDQWAQIMCVDMNTMTNNETPHTGMDIYAGTLARLHPSGNCIYGANNGLSPSDIERYDIDKGVANYRYDSPYHGDYSMNGNLWFTEDGTRIFTRGRTVLTTSETQSMDMKYNGTIALESGSYAAIQWLDHSAAKGYIYFITSGGDIWNQINASNVFVYKEDNLTFVRKYDLEKYYVPQGQGGKLYDAIPYFVFANSTGSEVYVITKANGSGLSKEWAIQKIAID